MRLSRWAANVMAAAVIGMSSYAVAQYTDNKCCANETGCTFDCVPIAPPTGWPHLFDETAWMKSTNTLTIQTCQPNPNPFAVSVCNRPEDELSRQACADVELFRTNADCVSNVNVVWTGYQWMLPGCTDTCP